MEGDVTKTARVDNALDAGRFNSVRELFSDRDYRLYWYSSATFGLGIWAFLTAIGWTALEQTDSAFSVSLVNVVYFLPMFVLAVPSGVMADMFSRRLNILFSRGASGVLVAVMAVMAGTGVLTFNWLLFFSFGVGLSVITELAARQALVAQIVAPERLVNATALTSFQGGFARVLGPLGAGWLIDQFGDSGGYWLFAATNVVFVYWFFQIGERVSADRRRPSVRESLVDLKDGFRYLAGHPAARAVVLISVLGGTVGWIYLALMPVMARDVLGGDAVTLGWLNTAVGLGSVPGAVALSLVHTVRREGRIFAGSMLLWGVGIIGFAYTRLLPLSVLLLFVSGMGFGAQTILTRTLLLRIVEPAFHGRVLGTLMLTWGANIAGTLLGGVLAETFGAPHVVAVSGALILFVTTVLVGRNPRVLAL